MKPKILFVYDNKRPEHWLDGLWAALSLLDRDFEIERWNLHSGKSENVHSPIETDFALGWGAFGSEVDTVLHNMVGKKGLCIAGNANPPERANNYAILFYETKWYRPQIDFHDNIWQAFGVNTDLFNAIDLTTPFNLAMPVVWDYIGVGALANWKRWERMTKKQGNRLVVGEYQKENEEESSAIAQNLLREGVMVSDNVHPFDLVNFYHWSRTLYIPADVTGGGERAILEARSCGLEVEIEDDNDKLRELLDCDIPSHHDYAKQLKKGIERCI